MTSFNGYRRDVLSLPNKIKQCEEMKSLNMIPFLNQRRSGIPPTLLHLFQVYLSIKVIEVSDRVFMRSVMEKNNTLILTNVKLATGIVDYSGMARWSCARIYH